MTAPSISTTPASERLGQEVPAGTEYEASTRTSVPQLPFCLAHFMWCRFDSATSAVKFCYFERRIFMRMLRVERASRRRSGVRASTEVRATTVRIPP